MYEIEANEDLINELVSDDAILHIFAYLPIIDILKTRLVCKRWQQLLEFQLKRRNAIAITIRSNDNNEDNDKEYWQRCDCNDSKHMMTSNDCIASSCRTIRDGSRTLYIINDKHLSNLFNLCPNIRALSLEFAIFDRNVWQLFRSGCPPNLEHLDFSNSQGLIDEVIRFIAMSCGPTLKHIKLVDSDISESSLKFLIEKCPNLELLDVSNNVRISGHSFSLFGNQIKQLSVNQCWNIKLDGIVSLVSGNGRHLQELAINGEFLDNHMIERICDHMKDLRKLEVDCSQVKKRSILSKISNCTHLTELTLYLPSINCDEVLIHIIKKCSQLEKIVIDGAIITDLSLKLLSIFCTHLKVLSISSGEIVVNKKISDVLCESLRKLSKLTKLDLQYTSIGDQLIDVVKDCPQLSTIEIDGCKRVTNKLIDSMIEIVSNRAQQQITVFARETKLVKPEIELPQNFELILE